MKALAVIIMLGLALASPARAALSQAQLEAVRVDARPNAIIPLSLAFVDDRGVPRRLSDAIGGTPAVLVFADYTCTNLCGPILAFAAGGLANSGLVPGKDFHLVVIGLDPRDDATAALTMKTSRVGVNTPLAQATTVLIGNDDAIRIATQAAGYHYVYDAEHDQFAHPAVAYVLTKDGKVTRVLSGLGLDGDDLRLALVEAGRGQVGSVLDRITLRCFGFDPARGIYTASIFDWLAIAGIGTVLVLFAGISFMALGVRGRTAP